MRKIVNKIETNEVILSELVFDRNKIYAGLDSSDRIVLLIPDGYDSMNFRAILLEDISIFNGYGDGGKFQDVVKTWIKYGKPMFEFENLEEFLMWGLAVVQTKQI